MKPTYNSTQQILLSTFLEESFDGLERLEEGLLQLDTDASLELINELFRLVHTMKGGSGVVGLVEIGALVHAMENILDTLRRGEPPSAETSSLLLRGLDAIRGSLRARQEGSSLAPDSHAALTAEVERHARAGRTAAPAPRPPARRSAAGGWEVRITPRADAVLEGVEPAAWLTALEELGGEIEADLARLPALDELDPRTCYIAWRVTVPSDVPRAALDACLADAAGACDVEIRSLATASSIETALPTLPAAPLPAAAASDDPASLGHQVSTIRVGVDKIDQLMNIVGELVITHSMLGELRSEGPVDPNRLSRVADGLGQLARALQDSVMRLRSMPISTVFKRFPRLVRDLGRQLGKEISLEISGETTELDRVVLEHLGDALVHIVRNCIDHGLESVDERLAAGKPREGTIRLRAEHRGGDVVVEVSDDGRGLDAARILATARKRGLIAPDATLDDSAAIQLVFQPGFSTASEVSSLSGRGVGMDVVKRCVTDLGGDISLDSEPGRGVRIAMRLPLTLAIIDGQLIQVGNQQFVLPLAAITESVRIDGAAKARLGGVCDVYRLRHQVIPMIDLAAVLGVQRGPAVERQVMVIVSAGGRPVGLVVDELLVQQQVVVKSLDTNYKRVPGLAGATILGNGRVAFILDVVAIAQAAQAGRAAAPQAA